MAAIALLTALPYLPHLGFYSDDWGILAAFDAQDRRGALFGSVLEDFVARPVQGLYLALLFKLFALEPLGYHLVNTAVIAGSAALLYTLLVRLSLGRRQAFATAVVFLLLPQLSTVRVWYAAFQIPLSMALMLASLHAQLTFARTRSMPALAGAVLAAVLSIGAYEIFAPLIVGFAVALALHRRDASNPRWRGAAIAVSMILAMVLLAVAYKILFSGRVPGIADPQRYLLGLWQLIRPDYDWRIHSGLNVFAAERAYFWLPVRGWATGAVDLLTGRSGWMVVAISVVLAALVCWRLGLRGGPQEESRPGRLLAAGIAVFVLGHVTFLIAPAILFTATGIGTRVQVAAAIGAAMIMVALMCFAAKLVGRRYGRPAFALAVAAVSVAAFARLAAIERYWAEAPILQQRILSAARSDLKRVPSGSTVILDGVCPYHGPAIVFETWWDVGGALTLALGRPMSGDAVSPRMELTATGLETSIYKQPSSYLYGPKLFVYDPRQHVLVPLPDAAAAARYFTSRTPADCPPAYVGRGVEI